MKRFIPNFIKYPFWYLFKAPQRQFGFKTLINDALAAAYYLRAVAKIAPKEEKLSICIGHYNREAMIREVLIPSMNQLQRQEDIELVLVDFKSAHIKDLIQFIELNWKGGFKYKVLDGPFTRAKAINEAAAIASHDRLFICDADFSVPENLLDLCYRYTYLGSIWFPIVFYLYKHKPPVFAKGNGEWMFWGGKGLLAIEKKRFMEMGGLDETFVEWGGEDEAFWLRCHQRGERIIRSHCKGLLHHWHPSLNPKYKRLEELADKGLL